MQTITIVNTTSNRAKPSRSSGVKIIALDQGKQANFKYFLTTGLSKTARIIVKIWSNNHGCLSE